MQGMCGLQSTCVTLRYNVCMRTPMTKAQRHKLLRTMREDSAFDELASLLKPIEEFISVEVQATKSRNPKVRARAERRILEIGEFGMELMNQLIPTYLRSMGKIASLRPFIREAIGQ